MLLYRSYQRHIIGAIAIFIFCILGCVAQRTRSVPHTWKQRQRIFTRPYSKGYSVQRPFEYTHERYEFPCAGTPYEDDPEYTLYFSRIHESRFDTEVLAKAHLRNVTLLSESSGLEVERVPARRRPAQNKMYVLKVPADVNNAGTYFCEWRYENGSVALDYQGFEMKTQREMMLWRMLDMIDTPEVPKTSVPGTKISLKMYYLVRRNYWPPTVGLRMYEGGLLPPGVMYRPNFTSDIAEEFINATHSNLTITLNYSLPYPVRDYQIRDSEGNYTITSFRLMWDWKAVNTSAPTRNEAAVYTNRPHTYRFYCAYGCEWCVGTRPRCARCFDNYTMFGLDCELDYCSPNPCQNNGQCRSIRSHSELFVCTCASGFGGKLCDENCSAHCPGCYNQGHCKKCETGYFLHNFVCMSNSCPVDHCLNGGVCLPSIGSHICDCPPGTAGDRCDQQCITNCQSCEADRAKCEECLPNYGVGGVNRDTCLPCQDHCRSCSVDNALCDTGRCEPGYVTDHQTNTCELCVVSNCMECSSNFDRCMPGRCRFAHGLNATTGECEPCRDPQCIRCDNDRNSCDNNRCPRGYVLNKNSGNCDECGVYCTSCAPGRLECHQSDCPIGFSTTRPCKECVPHCLMCSDVTRCDSRMCEPGYGIGFVHRQCTACPPNCRRCDYDFRICEQGGCEPHYGWNIDTDQCEPCNVTSCLRCDNNRTTCDQGQCPHGFRFDSDIGDCVECNVDNCVSCEGSVDRCDPGQCIPGYGLRTAYGRCERCIINCLSCEVDVRRCDANMCDSGFYFISDGHCDECPEYCSSCGNAVHCDRGRCIDQYTDDLDGWCVACPANCRRCDVDMYRCSVGNCMPEYGVDNTGDVCVACPPNCRKCDNNAAECDATSCKAGHDYNPNTKLCDGGPIDEEVEEPIGSPGCPALCNRCGRDQLRCDYDHCVVGFQANTMTGVCEACVANCLKCRAPGTCYADQCRENHRYNEDKGECEIMPLAVQQSSTGIVIGVTVGLLILVLAIAGGVIAYFGVKKRLAARVAAIASATAH